MSRLCPRCNVTKPLDQFGVDRSRSSGRFPYCRECVREHVRAYKARDPETVRASLRRSWDTHKAKRNAERRQKRAADPVGTRNRDHDRYERDRDRILQRQRQYHATPEGRARSRRADQTRRARRVAAFVEPVDPRVLLERDEGRCGICRDLVDPLTFHIDHIKPLAKGGEHSYANTQLAHPRCNLRKGAR